MDKLTPLQVRCIELLATGHRQVDIARQLEITPETISRWKNNDVHFIAHYNDVKQAIYDSVTSRLQELAHNALETLETVMNTSPNDNARVNAAKLILDHIADLGRPEGLTDPDAVQRLKDFEDYLSF